MVQPSNGIVTFVSVQWVRERYQIRRRILIDSLSWDEVAQNGRVAPHKLKALLTIGHLPIIEEDKIYNQVVGFFMQSYFSGLAYDSTSLFHCPQRIGKLHGNHFEEVPISCGNFTIGKDNILP